MKEQDLQEMNVAAHYTYRVRWSTEKQAYVGTAAEMPSLSCVAADQTEAFLGIRDICITAVTDMIAGGETPSQALADREYSGKFVVRIPPEAHRRLTIEAAEQNVSLNRLISARLTSSRESKREPHTKEAS